MKVELTITSLMLFTTLTTGDYKLKCTRNELGILWPIYEDVTVYYHCVNVGNPIIMACNAGTWFTFSQQTCTNPEDYIAPPNLKDLPTDSPSYVDSSTTSPFFSTTTRSTPTITTSTTISSTTHNAESTMPEFTLASPQMPQFSLPTPETPSGSTTTADVPMPPVPAHTPPVIDVSPITAVPNAPNANTIFII